MAHGLDALEPPPGAQDGSAGVVGRALAFINAIIVMLSSVALVLAAVVLTYSVASRYFLHLSTDWQDELAVFLIVGAVFMSSAAIQANRGHVGIEAIVGLLPPGVNRVRQLLVDAASLAFCAFFAWKSWGLLEEAIVENYHTESSWGPPLWIPYALMTAGMALLSLQILLQLMTAISRRGLPR